MTGHSKGKSCMVNQANTFLNIGVSGLTLKTKTDYDEK